MKTKEKDDGPVFQLFQSPLRDLTVEQQKLVIKEISQKNTEEFDNSFSILKEMTSKYDPLMVLSILAAYGLTTGVGPEGVQSEKETTMSQSALELCQALYLQNESIPKEYPKPDVIQKFFDNFKTISKAYVFKGIRSDNDNLSESDLAIRQLQEITRMYTQGVRNWGHIDQVKKTAKELYSGMDDNFLQNLGFIPSDAIEVFSYMVSETERKLSERMQMLKELRRIKNKKQLIRGYYKIQGLDNPEEFIEKIKPNKMSYMHLFTLIMSHSDLFLPDIYISSPVEIAKSTGVDEARILNIFTKLSMQFGDTKDAESVKFFLANPVWTKPIIKSKDKFFCPAPQLFFSFVFKIFDDLGKTIDGDSLSKIRSEYLENSISKIVKRSFKESEIVRSFKWKYNGDEYETDLLINIGTYLIIVEAKSGRISEEALRGAPERLKKHIREIVIAPSEQSRRLKKVISDLKNGVVVNTNVLEKFPFKLDNIRNILRVSVSLDDFAAVQSNMAIIKKMDFFPPEFEKCPSMNLADFETIFEILESPVHILHYFSKRESIEKTLIYSGDERDFLGLYTDTLLSIEQDIEDNIVLNIGGMSSRIDKYFDSLGQGVDIGKPILKVDSTFREIIDMLEERNPENWQELGVELLNIRPQDQVKCSNLLSELNLKIRKNPKHYENILVYKHPAKSKTGVCFIVLNNDNILQRDIYIHSAGDKSFEDPNIQQCLFVIKSVDRLDLPYCTIGMLLRGE